MLMSPGKKSLGRFSPNNGKIWHSGYTMAQMQPLFAFLLTIIANMEIFLRKQPAQFVSLSASNHL